MSDLGLFVQTSPHELGVCKKDLGPIITYRREDRRETH